MTIRERLKADLIQAMKARESHAVRALRTMQAAIDNAEAVEQTNAMVPTVGVSNDVPRKVLTEADVRTILQKEVDDRRRNIEVYESMGKVEAAEQLKAEVGVISLYLQD